MVTRPHPAADFRYCQAGGYYGADKAINETRSHKIRIPRARDRAPRGWRRVDPEPPAAGFVVHGSRVAQRPQAAPGPGKG
ncbi:hypothetical protein ACFVYE_42320 [Streptomyces sp. NPDC058239]|uniref:hypothetical protein n=1 Tax=Streptomyces sp. NPDC058239 TaxID=3346395 RepID=UPI0036EC1609